MILQDMEFLSYHMGLGAVGCRYLPEIRNCVPAEPLSKPVTLGTAVHISRLNLFF
jgi:hypothetical protein